MTIQMGAPLHPDQIVLPRRTVSPHWQLGPRSFGSIQAGPKHVIGPLWTAPYVRELQPKLQPSTSAPLRKRHLR